jgi:histone acetyltransferase (RNA polymerase elongator complex component)
VRQCGCTRSIINLMEATTHDAEPSWHFEQGPIRPPSEANSLLLRVTRNCPWNRCAFCPVYKGATFSIRPAEHVKRDIDAVHEHVQAVRALAETPGGLSRDALARMAGALDGTRQPAFDTALSWYLSGMRTVFLQDANSVAAKAADLVDILTHLRVRFPNVERVTSYGRSQTLAAKRESDLRAIATAGLNRIHIGMESGSDAVLALVDKGTTQAQHIQAGRKAKEAGMEVSEYVMPGLGGRTLSQEHALETASALNQVNPDFIRIRSLAIPTHVPLYEDYAAGRFQKCTDIEIAAEIRLFLDHLHAITSVVKSDHILNLFGDLEGKLPDDKPRMIAILDEFLALEPRSQLLCQVGRRLGLFNSLRDLQSPGPRAKAEAACVRFGITPANVDDTIDTIMRTFI